MNCARIIYGNQVATNGVVHVIDRVISAVGSTIEDKIAVDDDLTTLNVSTQKDFYIIANTAAKMGHTRLQGSLIQ